jgi:subtilisin family serine protease
VHQLPAGEARIVRLPIPTARRGTLRSHTKRACAAAAAATAIAAGLTGLAQATTAQATAVPAAVKSAESTAKGAGGNHRITLITGDRVVVDAKGRFVGMERAKGRERVPVQVRTVGGHTLVVPMDAARLIAGNRLDQRLFDITELDKTATRRIQRGDLKIIVGYRGATPAAKADVRDTGTLHATFKSLNADAIQTPAARTPELWDAVTNGDKAASGIAHVWLDGVRKASLDKSVPQIGAPTAWAKGYTGKGVKVAVLDSGIDTTHPDLKTQVIAAKNFTSAADTSDRFGHGTHVASIIAGTGAKSGGKYKGVALSSSTARSWPMTAAVTTPASSRAWSGPPSRAPTSSTSASEAPTPRAPTRSKRR